MQLCSLHHCLLFFILTFTTAPVSALEICSTRAKLHQPVTLSCTHRCLGLFEWNLLSNRSVVLARCDQTSCWAQKGFSISYDKYLNGDFSLTITEADYSKRNVYACECRDSDFNHVRLVIETVFTPVQMKSDEDLKLKVSVPEPVEVIYKRGDAADEVICSVTKDSLQCKDDYRHRTSLTYPEITLRHMTKGDSGSYTIRDTKNNEDIQIYDVFVEEKPGFPAWGIVLILILPCCCVGAGIFLLYKRHMRKQLKWRQQLVDQLVQEAEGGTEEKIREAEKTLDQLQQQYNNTVYKDQVKVFCSDKREQMFEGHLKQVDLLVQEALGGTEEKEEKIRKVEKTLKQPQQQYNNTVYELKVTVFCRDKRRQLLNTLMLPLVKPVQKNKGWKKEDTDDVHHMLNWLKDLYRNTKYADEVTVFCMKQRSQMNWWRLQYSDDDIDKARREMLNRKLRDVEQLVQQDKPGTKEITEAKKAIDELELQYSYTEYSEHVSMLCDVKRKQLDPLYSNKGLITPDTELNRKLHHVEQLVQQAKAGTEEKITEAKKAIDELELQYNYTEYSEHVSVLCDVKRKQLIQLYGDKGLIPPDRELNSRVDHVEKFVQQAKGGTEEIRKAEEAISELELDYFTTKYSGRVSWFCMTKRAELYWYRLLHSDNK